MRHYNLHDLVYLTVKGIGRVSKHLKLQFSSFLEDLPQIPDNSNVIEIKISPITSGKLLLGKLSKDCYQRDHERFIIIRNGAGIELNGLKKLKQQKQICIEEQAHSGLVMLMIEGLIRLKVIGRKVVLVHAAAVSNSGKAILLPAWQSSGKTAACLTLVNYGYDYLADDRVWVSSGGKVLSYPRYIRLNRANIHLFSKLLSLRQKLQYFFHRNLEILFLKVGAARRSQILRKIVQSGYFLPDVAEPLENLTPSARIVKNAQLKALLYLQKSGKPYGRVVRFCAQIMSDKLAHINFYEWNHELMLHAAAHDLLFPDGEAWLPEIYAFQDQERIVIGELTENTIRRGLNLPFEQALFPDTVLREIDGLLS